MSQVEPRGRGRPAKHALPPRIDAAPEAIAKAFFRSPAPANPRKKEYRCGECDRQVHYPETLYNDGKCSGCHS